MFKDFLNKIKNRKTLVLLILLFFAANILIIYNTYSEKTTSIIWDGTISKKFSKGSGTSSDPYIISNGSELAYFFTVINGNESSNYFNKFYEINNNIDLNGYDFSFSQNNKSFSGQLNGNGYTISNFVLEKYYLNDLSNEANFNLFDTVFNGKIKNINFKDITFKIDELNDNNEVTDDKTENNSNNQSTSNEEISNDNSDSVTDNQSSDNEESLNNEDKVNSDSTDLSDSNNENIDIQTDTSLEKILIEKINISLFKNVESSKINNITIKNVKINIKEQDILVDSSLFILNDINNNKVENVFLSSSLDVLNSPLLIKNYNNAEVNNIVYIGNELELINDYKITDKDTFYKFYFKNNKLVFKNDYSINSILKLLNENSELKWKYENNSFRILNNGKDSNKNKKIKKSMRSAPSAHDSEISGNTIYINDYDADYNYYEGMNYTYSSDGSIPTTENKNIYTDKNLAFVQITYSGTNIEGNKTGTVSNTENQSNYIYYKVYPVNNNGTSNDNEDDYIEIDLIDNPFARRPNDNVFQGWLTSYEGTEISLDTDVYVRRAKIPVTYSSETPNNINITFNAIWGNGVITNYTTNWSTTFGYLEANGFNPISQDNITYIVTGMYEYDYISNNRYYPDGAVNANGQTLTGRCSAGWGRRCYYYIVTTSNYNANTDYYTLVNGTMTLTDPPEIHNYTSEIPVGNSIAGYYRSVRVPYGASLAGYFNSTGTSLESGTCNTNGGCTNYYELIQYYDINGDVEVVTTGQIYYYKTTRDTNVVVLSSTVNGTWASGQNKPFTFTGINNGTTYNTYWGLYRYGTYYTPTCYADTRIEHMHVYTNVAVQTNDTTPSGNRGIYGANYNLKLGRGLTSSTGNGGNTTNDYVTFRFAAGSSQASVGSSTSATTDYNFIVESGIYNNIAVVGVTGTDYTYNIHAHGTFGNDYDRITELNSITESSMTVIYELSGSFSGNIYSSSKNDISIFTNIKSGRYGTNKYDIYTGVYFGSQLSGSLNAARAGIVEGGWIYNLIGGPLSSTSLKNVNDNIMYIKGGSIDVVFGGAGIAATYGNKIIQMTGGQVNYSIFGGSNGNTGNNTTGASVDSDTYVYVGGNAVVGDPDLVSSNSYETLSNCEAGSVFGIGNGKNNANASSMGSANNSNVVINGNATINKNVYGGGNYGATGLNGTNHTYNTKILINGGEIKGSVYGGGNNNGAGSTSNTCNINIVMKDGTVDGSVYGGSRTKGTIYGSTEVNILSGNIVNDVYGGGEGGYQQSNNNSTPGTYVSNNVTINIGNTTDGPTITGSVYGGSAYGTVNATSNNPSTNNKTVTVNVNNGTVMTSVFGGAKGSSTYTPYIPGNITVNVSGGTITNVFGGFDEAGKPQNDPYVNITGGTITNVYGGGNKTSVDNTHIDMQGGTVTTMYGGSNQSGDVLTTNISLSGGTAGTIFGGNNEGGTCAQTNIEVTGGTVNSAIYGGGNLVNTGTTKIDIYNASGTIPNVYGGGNQAGATTTTVNLKKRSGSNTISITNVYGGSNQSGLVTTSNVNVETGNVTNIYGGGNSVGVTTTNVTLNNDNSINVGTIYGGSNQTGDVTTSNVLINGGNVTTVYGSNNAGGTTTTSYITQNNGNVGTIYGGENEAETTDTHVTINSGSVNTIFGGGNQAQVTNATNVIVNNASSTITNVFGGGNQAGTPTTNVTINPSNDNLNITNVFGGSNQSGTISESNITIEHGTITNVYGGNNEGGKTSIANTIINNGVITNAYGGGNQAETDTSNITVNDGTLIILYGGGNQANINNDTNVELLGGTVNTNVFGGGNEGQVLGNTNVTLNNTTVNGNVFAGGNGSTATVVGNTLLNVSESTISHDIYGGGNNGIVSGNTNVTIDDVTILGSVYAGGNGASASVNQNTTLKITDSNVSNNVYGGGNNGTVTGNTDVIINDSNINKSAYAGGNGSTATVFGNTSIIVGGSSVIGTNSCTVLSTCSVFGGGNAATTGSQATDNSTASVKIAGATVYGNIYGGANTSKVYGQTNVDIGSDVTLNDIITRGNISIHGTVFGGGEANASGSDEYDWTFVSVTKAIVVNINGQNYQTFEILGSIFGSGNASTTTGTSEVTIKNYGTFENPKRNISVQRTDLLKLDNSAMVLSGATDRENEYSDVLFTLSRIQRLDLTNNSTLYLETGANLLEEFNSLTSSGEKASVSINENTKTVTKNVDNRVYMFIDKKLNIAKDQNVTDYGEVNGMSFFGMYKYNSNGTINTGIYDDFDYDETLNWGDVFDNVSSYVLGLHKANHDIEVDGFYTNYIDEETSKNKIDYIEPTPPTGPLYMWTIGEGVIEYEFELSASKYSTLGTHELSLIDFTDPNTSFQILGFDYSELDSSISLVEKSNIKKIADTDTEADTIMGLSMETSNIGWLVNGNTSFLTNANNPIVGTRDYIGGNNSSSPTLLFSLYHAKNISSSGNLGKVRIQLLSIRQINALTKETKRLNITINLSRALFDTVNYEGAMTAGRKYELFTSTATNITSSSSISAYYSLFNNNENIYRTGYHRALVSNYVLPLNTKITMIDYSGDNPEYYYHVISQSDVTRAQNELQSENEVSYNISMFEVMGAENSGVYYDDQAKNIQYYNATANYCNEEFIFIIDFGDTNITSNALGNQLLIEMRDSNDEAIHGVLGQQYSALTYNIYADKDATIDIDGTLSSNKIYNGQSVTADLNITYTQEMVGSTVIYDTHYFDSKLGIKISLINSDGDVVTGSTLLGLYYTIDGVNYYPNIDGTTRIKITDKVDSAEKWVFVNTGTSTIASGNYTLRFESFGSPDGIYYGINSNTTKDFAIEIINEIYGLDVSTTAEEMIIDSLTGKNANDNNHLGYNIKYNSGLNNPSVKFKMYRRSYEHIDDTNYILVDAKDYFDNVFTNGTTQKEYTLINNPSENNTFIFTFKNNLVTGTYKMEFILYDGSSAIGSVEKYIIIK